MSLYRICGIILESDYSFPELLPVDRGGADCTFSLQGPRPTAEFEWFHQRVQADGEAWLLLGRSGSDYVLRFPELAEFEISSDGRCVRCYPASPLPSDTLGHLVIDQVIPLLLTLYGEVVLHASAVRGAASAVAFIGKSGSGKSTQAAALAKFGLTVISDDALVVRETSGHLCCIPSYPGLRLWESSLAAIFGPATPVASVAHYTSKVRVGPGETLQYCASPVPLSRVYLLDPQVEGSDISIDAMSPQQAFMSLVEYSFHLDITDRQTLRANSERLSKLAVQPVWRRLCYPLDLTKLGAVAEAVIQDSEVCGVFAAMCAGESNPIATLGNGENR